MFYLLGGGGFADVAVNAVNFPDENFRDYVSGFDEDGDGSLSDSEISAVKIIDVHKDYDELDGRISSLKGTEYFTGLISLDCSRNDLTELDVSSNTALVESICFSNYLSALDLSSNTALTYLDCDGNNLTTLDVSSNTALTYLDCSYNHLMALDVSKNTSLVYLGCRSNRFTALDVNGHRNLQELYCEDDEENAYLKTINASGCTSLTNLNVPYSVTHLNVSGCTALEYLYCENDEGQGSLSSLNLTACTALQSLYCSNRKLTSLNLSSCTNLKELYCYNNALTVLDVSKNPVLENLDCSYNYLTLLNISSNTALTTLGCNSNYLTALDVSSNTALTRLDCSSNKLTDLDVSSNTKLESLKFDDNYLSEIDLSGSTTLTTLSSSYNQFASLDLSECTALDYLYCDFPITAGSNSTWEFDFTAFKEAYGIDGEFDSSHGADVYYYGKYHLTDYTIDQSSGKYILRFLRLAEGTLENVHFRCRLKNSNRYISISLVPSVDSSSLTAPLITTSSLPAASLDKDGYYQEYDGSLSAYGSQPMVWKIVDGFLPVGLTMYDDGEIDGYPRAAGSSTFTVRARNKAGSSTRTFTIVVPYTTQGESPFITAASLTAGTSGIPYGFQLTADGTAPITWIADDFPDGLSLSSAGYISGTPSESGTFSLSVTASNDYGTDSRTMSLTAAEPPSGTKPSITTDELDPATAGTAYAYQLGVSGTPPFTFTVKGKLPDGLSMNSSGLISCTPKKKGSKKFTITAKNSQGSETKKLTLTVCELPEILTETLKDAKLGKKYSMALKTKGTKPLTWELDGDLPEGITFDADKGKFSGTPTEITTGAVNITLTNSAGSVSQTYTLNVAGTPPKIGLSRLKAGTYGKNYKAALKVKGSEPITLTLVGELPEGLSFDSEEGTITGTPTEACTDREIRIIASNAADVVSRDYTLTIKAAAPKITTKKLPDAVKGNTYSADIEVTGTPEITFTASGLPSGLSMNTSGEISGTPTKFGKFSVKITAKNSAKTAKNSMNLTVLAATEFSGSSTLSSGTQGKSYKHTFSAAGSKTITFSVSGGSLPNGVTLSAKGKLSGKPTESGTFEFTVKAANSAGEASKDFTLTIAANTANKSAGTYPENGTAVDVESYEDFGSYADTRSYTDVKNYVH